MKLTPGDVECRLLKSVNSDHIRQAIPLAQFCKLSSQGKIAVEPFDGPATDIVESGAVANPHEPPIAVDERFVWRSVRAAASFRCKRYKEPAIHEKSKRGLAISY
jgi:hypothetical protein